MNHQSDLDVFLIKAYKVLTLQRRGITDDQEAGSLISSGQTSISNSQLNLNDSTENAFDKSDKPDDTNVKNLQPVVDSDYQAGSESISTINPTTNSTLFGNTSDRVVTINIADFINTAGSSPYHQMGLTNEKDNELFNKISKLYNVIFISESGVSSTFMNLNFKDSNAKSDSPLAEETSKLDEIEKAVSIGGATNASLQRGLKKRGKNYKNNEAGSGCSPKSPIELYQRFYQIIRELDLNYEGCPYSKYFIKVSGNLLQIKSDNELILDPVWKSITYKFFGKYKYIKLITQLTSSNPSTSSKSNSARQPANNNGNNNTAVNYINSSFPLSNTSSTYSTTGDYQLLNRYNSYDNPPRQQNDQPNNPVPTNQIPGGPNNSVAESSKNLNLQSNTNDKYVLNTDVKQKVKKLQRERKSTRKGYFTTPTSPTTSWMNNFLNTSDVNDLNPEFTTQNEQIESQLSQKPTDFNSYAPVDNNVLNLDANRSGSNNVLDSNTITEFENSLLNLQAAGINDTLPNKNKNNNNNNNNNMLYTSSNTMVDPITGQAQSSSISATNLNTMLFNNHDVPAMKKTNANTEGNLAHTANVTNSQLGSGNLKKRKKMRRNTGNSYYNNGADSLLGNNKYNNDTHLPESNSQALSRRSKFLYSGTTPGHNTPMGMSEYGNMESGLIFGNLSYAPSVADDDENDEEENENNDAFVEQQKRQQMIINAATNALHAKANANVDGVASTKNTNTTTGINANRFNDGAGIDVDMQELISFSNKLSPNTGQRESDVANPNNKKFQSINNNPMINGLPRISETTLVPFVENNGPVGNSNPLNMKHNTSIDGGSESGHSRSQSRRRNSIVLNNGMPKSLGNSAGNHNPKGVGFKAGNKKTKLSKQLNNNYRNENGTHLNNQSFGLGSLNPQTKNLNSVNMQNTSSSNHSITPGNSINSFDLYDRLMKEKDLRIQQLEQEIELQRQETLWLRKMLTEDMGVVRGMLKDLHK